MVQDIFLTETAEFADVILPASSYLEKDGTYTNTDRRVQRGRKVLDPPGQARVDWEIVLDLAQRLGLGWSYSHPREVFDEMVAVMPSYANLSYDNLGLSGKLYPNADPEHSDGTVVMFDERFNTADGLAHLVPAEWLPAKELPDGEFPLVLNTGRLLEHWHTGSMTRRSYALDAISPEAEVYMHPKDAADRGLQHGEMVRARSRRGEIELRLRVSHREALGNCFIPFHFREAAANLLTIDEVDPYGKIPEFKFCAVQVEAIGSGDRDDPAKVPGVEARAGKFPGPSLIPELNAIQARLGWLPREELTALSREMRRPLYEIEGLVSFYPHFRTDPPAKVARARLPRPDLLARRRRRAAGHAAGAARGRGGRRVQRGVLPRPLRHRARRRGQRAPGPVGGHRRAGGRRPCRRSRHAAPTPSGRAQPWPNDPYAPGEERYRVLRSVLTGERTPQEVIAAVNDSGLRGMGGAGFPTGRSGSSSRTSLPDSSTRSATPTSPSPAPSRTGRSSPTSRTWCWRACCSAWSAPAPSRGMCSSATSTGPRSTCCGRRSRRSARRACSARRARQRPHPPAGHLHLARRLHPRRGVGADRGHGGPPRRAAQQAPVPGIYGLWGRPTLMNSVETFADVPVIVERGAQWWRDQGVGDSVGWKFFAVSGHVERPGVYCVPMGTTARALLEEAGGVAGGAALQAIQPGGASSNFLGPDQLDVPLDFGTLADAGSMLGSGALVAIAEGTDLLAASTNVLRFFRDESCGKCVPCRVGSTKAHTLLTEAIAAGGLDDAGRERILELELVMRKTSICGLGQVALGPVVSVLGMQRGATTVRRHPKNDDPEFDDKASRNGQG